MKMILKMYFLLLMIFHVAVELYAINPNRDYIRTPDSLGLDFESLNLHTYDGYDIHTWIYAANPEKDNCKILLLAYPDAGNMSYFVYHSAILASHGYTVVTFDYRGFGKSSDFEIDQDSLYYNEFAIDLSTVAEVIYEKFPNKEIGIWALSMGTIITVKAMESLKGKVQFLISEGFVSDPSLIVERTFEQKDKVLILPENGNAYFNSLKKIDIPILIFTATLDQITTYDDALNVKKQVNGRCEIVLFEGEHLGGFNFGDGDWGAYYVGEINRFLEGVFV